MKPLAPFLAALVLAGCASTPTTPKPGPAVGGAPAIACEQLAQRFVYADTRVTSVEAVAAGSVKLPGIAEPMPAHCRISGRMHERVSPVDGKPYAISFEMRLPSAWNGRFFYQANGGLDGFVTPAWGDILGGGTRSNGLLKGFAVLSSDAGHAFERNVPGIGAALFGVDPQARLDYGYNAVAQLAPMAQALIAAYYGKRPDRSYLVGTSNGGRHGLVAAARDSGGFDGIAVTTPGYNLPRAAVAQVWDAQQFARVARPDAKSGRPDLQSGFTSAELALLSAKILERCDALDGLADGIVADVMGCQRAFDVQRDVPSCTGAAGGDCLSDAQKAVLAAVFAGPKTRDGRSFYAGLPWDAGVRGNDWRAWKFDYSVGPRDAIALAYVFTTPPSSPSVVNGQGTSLIDFALKFDIDTDAPKIFARNERYTQSAMQFMTPPDADAMSAFVARGGKLLVAHGASDPVFSALDTVAWYERFVARHGPAADDHLRLYLVPGMNHSRGGIATDQFDLVDALVAWVERGEKPQALVAAARGPGANVVNSELPASWAANRTRLLCPYPQVARYNGRGDTETAASFHCSKP
ncbi:MAG: tannase/feruloyl esterase family alpha/beta hydrolase [Betaproteobacteria bacterium]|nr:MAG: tannase/feruloyl esterase family alpha/beta hydrolase [Betaproteobacteria bacterium]